MMKIVMKQAVRDGITEWFTGKPIKEIEAPEDEQISESDIL
jgi:hypothetical protein